MVDLEVLWSEVQPSRIPMDPILLKSAITGDEGILDGLLREDFPSGDLVGAISITIPEDANRLLGVTYEGNTALHIVASRGYLNLFKKICNRARSLLTAPNVRLDTPLHCAARAGHYEIVCQIIQSAREDRIEAKKVLRATNMGGANALHEAAKYNKNRVARALMEEDAELAVMLNDAGMSPLYLAILKGSLDVAQQLLLSPSSEKPSLAFFSGPDKRTVLHAAALLDPSDNDARTIIKNAVQGKPARARAVKSCVDARTIIAKILQRKPMLARAVDSTGRIPLHYAASDGHHQIVELLLKRDPCAAYLSDAHGLFPIHIAAKKGNFLIVDEILQRCPEAYKLSDGEGKNFLHAALQDRKLDVVQKILSGRPQLKDLLNEQDNEGNTLLHIAVQNNDKRSVRYLLLDRDVDIDVMNHGGFTPRDLAKGHPLSVVLTPEDYTATCLYLFSAKPGSPTVERVELSRDEAKEKPSGNDDKFKEKSFRVKEISKQLDAAKDFVIAAVLVATVAFAAGFTIPGGFIADDHPGHGTMVLSKKYAFKVFLISDTFALVCSAMATFWFTYSTLQRSDVNYRVLLFSMGYVCLWVAFTGMSAAFAMGIYVALPSSSKRISILICIITLGAPVLTNLVVGLDYFGVIKIMAIRLGYVYFIFMGLGVLCPFCATYAIFFLLALL